MPILRSTRSRKNQTENKENTRSRKEQDNNSETVRVGRSASSKSRRELKEKQTQALKKTRTKIMAEEDNVEANKKSQKDLSEATESKQMTAIENEVEQLKADEPMDVANISEEYAECSQNKKPRINDPDPEKSEQNIDTIEKEKVEKDKDQKIEAPKSAQVDAVENEKPCSHSSIKSRSISLKAQSSTAKSSAETSSASSNLPKQLLTVISNLYLNVGERLHLDFPPRCLDDLAFCHRNHYRSELPDAPMTSQAQSLRSALQHYRYVFFINATTDMCHRGEFPGKGIFTKLIELVLSINYTTKQPNVNISIYQQSYHKSISLFSMVVQTFPPCWHKMRTYYVGFLEYGLDSAKLKSNKEETPPKSSKIFDILLDLLEEALKTSTTEDISVSKSETIQYPQNVNSDATSSLANTELSMCSEYWNQNEYEERERQKQTFDALPMDQKLERIFMALRLLLQILENDLAMWMLHHNKKTKEWIFCAENRPLIVVLCELTQFTRMTRVARRIFSVYSEAAAKGMCKKRLKVLERFISLLMVASNTADMENTAIGVKYPFLGEQTKTLVHEFFKIFKAHNRENISKYMETIELLRIPYVRYEFIDNVLIMFQFTNSEPLTPQKIALDIAKKRWLKYKPAAELTNLEEDISREQYMHLLLDALRSYCDFHGSKTFLHVITNATPLPHLTTTNDSVHRWPTRGSGVLVLKKMADDISLLESKLKMTVRMSKPKVELPLADICIDEAIIMKYRNDLKFIVSLQNVLLKQKETYADVDFNEWLEYLNDFAPRKLGKEDSNEN